MKAVAGRELGGLHPQDQGETLEVLFEYRASGKDSEKTVYICAIRCTFALDNHAQAAALEPEDDRHTDESLVTDQADLNGFSIGLSGKHRAQPVVQEIYRANRFSSLMQNLMEFEPHKF
jgi:hypothetical protein